MFLDGSPFVSTSVNWLCDVAVVLQNTKDFVHSLIKIDYSKKTVLWQLAL